MAEGPNDDTNTCSICWEGYTTPKMLKCRHTFCLPCLEGFQKKSEDKEIINCPLCRQKHRITDGNLDKLLDNYFVTSKPREPLEKFCCSLCFEEAILKACSHCELKLCLPCKLSHRLALKLSDEKYELSSDSESDVIEEPDDVDLSDDAMLPGHLAFTSHMIKTKPNATLMSSFKVSSVMSAPECGQDILVSTIHSVGNGLCEVITDLGPECVLVDSKGVEMQREFFDNGITDVVDIGVETKIFSNFHLSMLLKVEKGKGVRLFSRTGKIQPTAVCQLGNGEIACVGPHVNLRDESRNSDSDNAMGELQFYDKHGQLSKKITGNIYNKTFFKYPIGMSFCKMNCSLCISDTNCVYIFRQDGELLYRYTGSNSVSNDRDMGISIQMPFHPRPICHDEAGNIFVGNVVDQTIHILNSDGVFQGYLATRCKTGFGNPSTLRFDSENRLWIGDSKDGTIRVFEITSYNNLFHEGRSPISLPGPIRLCLT